MSKLKRGQRLACVPCGLEVVVDSCCGASEKTIWCCGKPMTPEKKKTAKKKTTTKRKGK